jgi:2-iminobutanoate/2-iminopropanoate deaminase
MEIRTNNAPLPVGPYSQGVEVNGLVFYSGILPLNLETKTLINDDIKEAAAMICTHMDNLLKGAGLNKNNVVKTTIFMKDLSDFSKVNEVYGNYFEGVETLPARSTVEVSRLPLDANIEIEFIARK